MTIKEIIETQEVKFKLKGYNNYKNEPKIFEMSHKCGNSTFSSVRETLFGDSMNVEKFGKTCMWLYSYDMLGNRTKSKVLYSDITIVEEADN